MTGTSAGAPGADGPPGGEADPRRGDGGGAAAGDDVERAAAGDPVAFDRLAGAHRPAVLRMALRVLGDPAAAEDVAQEALLRMHSALAGFRREAELGTWLYRVTLNLCRDHLRARRRRGADLRLEVAPDVARVDPRPGEDVDRERAREAVRLAIDALPADQREAVRLRYLADLPYDEIARLTGTPPGTVASRLYRALRRLGEALESRHMEVIR